MQRVASNMRSNWCGAVASGATGILFALSFVATPVKFMAPNVAIADLLAVGRVTFRASFTVELVMLAIMLVLARGRARYLIVLAGTILAMQWLALMPSLDARTLAVMMGDPPPPSPLHIYWIAADILRLGIYAGVAVLSFKGACRTSH